jgi:hypothetical protein
MAPTEDETDARLPYRIGYPKLPALPVKNTYVRTGLPEEESAACWDGIEDILEKYSYYPMWSILCISGK